MESPIPPDPYKTLGIDKTAPLATVRSAHRKLVLTCHPDKVTDESAKKAASDKFHLVQQAYEILSDETRRERYDERVKLADLRAQMMKEKGGSRIIPDVGIRGGPKRTHEMRDNTIYEYREPREPPLRSRAYEEEDYFQPRYQEVRPKRYDDRSFAPTPKKPSGRTAEEKRRARDLEDERERRKELSRAEDKARAEKSRKRNMERKKDYEYKNQSSRKFATVQDDDSSSDSDSTETFIRPRREEAPKKRYEDERRREKEDTPRRNIKRDSYEDYDDKHSRAQDYITQSRSSVEPEPRPLASHNRSFSYAERPPPPPAAPTVPVVDTSARRSSARDSRRREPSLPRLSKKDRRVTEIVDPPPSRSRKPSLPGFTSDPKGLKLPQSPITPRRDRDREPHRSATLEHTPEPRQPTIRRSETMPSSSRRTDNAPTKSSRLKEQHDSGYSSRSSPGVSPAPSPQMTSTRYRYTDDSEDEVTIVAEPEETYRRHRDNSPPTSRRERPKLSSRESKMPGREPTSSRPAPTMRSGSYAIPADQINPPRQPFVRTESGRPPPLKARPSNRGATTLYGEVQEVLEPYEIVNQSPKYRSDDIRYADYPRRGSADDRDAYGGSPRHRPEFSRSESRAVHA